MPPWFSKKSPGPQANARPAKAAPIRISDLIDAAVVLTPPAGQVKADVLEVLAGRLCERHGLGDPAPFVAKVREREQGISTTLDTGLSLPHARVDNLPRVVAGLAVCPSGIADPKQPDAAIRAMFMFFSPNRQDAFSQHLQVLRSVSTLFDAALIDAVCKAATPESILSILRAKER